MNTQIIRPAEQADLERMVAIARNEWLAIYEGFRAQLGEEIFAQIYHEPLAQKEAQIRENLKSDLCFVTECDGEIAGFITCRFDANTKIGRIGNNAVSADFRGQGIGVRQYEFVFERFREMGASIACVTTGLDEAHAPARRAYEKAGFSASLSSVTYYKKL